MSDRFVYEQSIIGSGGFGKVRKGKDTLLERDIAIKTLDPLAVEFTEAERAVQERSEGSGQTFSPQHPCHL